MRRFANSLTLHGTAIILLGYSAVVAAESGVLAGLAWLALVLAAPFAAWRDRDRAGRLRFWGTAAVIVTLLTLSMLDHYLWSLTAGRAIFWTSLGITMAYRCDKEVAT